jgi:hypothetical protein
MLFFFDFMKTSPCSALLKDKRTSRRHLLKNVYSNLPFNISAQIKPVHCPNGNAEVLLGSSSSARKSVFDALQWEHRSLSADIDGKISFLFRQFNSFI